MTSNPTTDLLALCQEIYTQLASPNERTPAYIEHVANLLEQFNPEENEPKQALIKTLLEIAKYLCIAGKSIAGVGCLAWAERHAEDLGDKALMRKAFSFHGILLADLGDCITATEKHARALQIAIELEDPVGEGAAWNNLAGALIYSCQYEDALLCLDRSLHIATHVINDPSARISANNNIGLACLRTGDYERGMKAMRQAIAENMEPKSPHAIMARTLSEANYIQLLVESGRVGKAQRRCGAIRRFAALSKSPVAEVNAYLATGYCEVHGQMGDIGLSRLTRALEIARSQKSALHDVLMALTKAHDQLGYPEQSFAYLQELMSHLKKTQRDNAKMHDKLHRHRIVIGTNKPEHANMWKFMPLPVSLDVLEKMAIAAELPEDSSGEHIYRVGRLSYLLANDVGINDGTCHLIELGARLHDIGKSAVPTGIITKCGELSTAEKALMRTHPEAGAQLITDSGISIPAAHEIALHHHEHWNGRGYPYGLSGDSIPISARIVALADAFDSMTHPRSYRPALPTEEALDLIASQKGRQFDPQLTPRFIATVRKLLQTEGSIDAILAERAHYSSFIEAKKMIAKALEGAAQHS